MSKPIPPTALGERLKEARLEAGYSPERLAGESGVRYMTIYRIESGQTPDPHWSTVVAIATALNVDLEWLAAPTLNDGDEAA